MSTKIIVQALAQLFTTAQCTEIQNAIASIVDTSKRGAEKWEYIVKLYHDGKTADLDKKRSISAAFKVECNAKDYSDDSAKSMFSSGTSKAEIALGYKTMPTPGASKGKKSTESVNTATKPGATADLAGAALTLEVAAVARELGDRVAHFQTHQKLTKDATEAIGKIAELIGVLNVKLGNVETR